VWRCDAVDAAAEVLAGGGQNGLEVFKNLGRARASSGVFIDEARADAQTAARVAGLDELSASRLLDAVTIGWIGREMDAWNPTNLVLDPLTGLSNVPYFMLRYAELSAEAAAIGSKIEQTHALVVISLLQVSDAIKRETSLITVHQCLQRAFRRGETLFRVERNCAAAITARDPASLQPRLSAVQLDLARARQGQRIGRTRCWVEPVPGTRSAMTDLLRELGR
jgi:hypothetical protein